MGGAEESDVLGKRRREEEGSAAESLREGSKRQKGEDRGRDEQRHWQHQQHQHQHQQVPHLLPEQPSLPPAPPSTEHSSSGPSAHPATDDPTRGAAAAVGVSLPAPRAAEAPPVEAHVPMGRGAAGSEHWRTGDTLEQLLPWSGPTLVGVMHGLVRPLDAVSAAAAGRPPADHRASAQQAESGTRAGLEGEEGRRRQQQQAIIVRAQPPPVVQAASSGGASSSASLIASSASSALVPSGRPRGSLPSLTTTSPPSAPSSGPDLLAEFQCPICFDLLCRPCPIECGMVVCESCLARTLKHSYTHPAGNRACPVLGADCKWGPVRRMPGVQAVLHNHLRSLFPDEYERRLSEDRENGELVELVRSAANNASGTISRSQLLRRRGGGAAAVEADAWRANPPPPPPPQPHHGLHHPAVAEVEAVLLRFRDDMEALAAEPIRFPDVFAERRWIKTILRYVVPGLLTLLALRAFPGHTPEGLDPDKLRSMSNTAFAQAYVVKSMGWWDVGLLMTCHSQPGFVYQVPPIIRSRLSSLKSVLVSRQLWPYERLLIASWMDLYHRVASTFYVISWSLSTLYLTAYCMFHRVQRRRREGVAWPRILLCELGLLAYLALCCEAWNTFWWLLCRVKFGVFQCAIDYRLTPANIIEGSIISLILELIFIVSMVMGAAVDPNDYLLLTATWLEQPEEWDKDLQVTVLSRFAFVYVPRRILSWF